MREKIFSILNKIYGIVLLASFFAGIFPLIPFVVAIIVGGPIAEQICLFIYKQYYPWVIAAASISVIVGLIAMYVGKLQTFSIKKTKKTETETEPENANESIAEQKIDDLKDLNINTDETQGEQ
jgi:hypothetical protein